MIKILTVLIFILSFSPSFAGNKFVKNQNQERKPSYYNCAAPLCERMNLLLTNLITTKKEYQKQVQKTEQKDTVKISNEERVWNAQQSEVYQFVCAFNFDGASSEVRETFFKFVKAVHKIMDDNIFRLEASQCFYGIVQAHQKEADLLMAQLGGKISFNPVLSQGKPAMEF